MNVLDSILALHPDFGPEAIHAHQKQDAADELFLDLAERISLESKAVRLKVGACIVRGNNMISFGWNGTPSGMDNTCEHEVDGELVTKSEVLHAESNALMKLLKEGTALGAQGCTLYTLYSPCKECSKLIIQAGIKRVVFREYYRDRSAIDIFDLTGVEVVHKPKEGVKA